MSQKVNELVSLLLQPPVGGRQCFMLAILFVAHVFQSQDEDQAAGQHDMLWQEWLVCPRVCVTLVRVAGRMEFNLLRPDMMIAQLIGAPHTHTRPRTTRHAMHGTREPTLIWSFHTIIHTEPSTRNPYRGICPLSMRNITLTSSRTSDSWQCGCPTIALCMHTGPALCSKFRNIAVFALLVSGS